MDYSILITILVAFVITAILGPVFIPVLRRIKAGQSIREDGPKAHQTKAGTPTMGGLMIILAVVITCISMTIRQGVGSKWAFCWYPLYCVVSSGSAMIL